MNGGLRVEDHEGRTLRRFINGTIVSQLLSIPLGGTFDIKIEQDVNLTFSREMVGKEVFIALSENYSKNPDLRQDPTYVVDFVIDKVSSGKRKTRTRI